MFLSPFFGRKLFSILVLLFAVVLSSGGLSMVNVLLNGGGSTLEARFALTSPFFGVFVLVGFFGLLTAYKRRGSREGFLGLVIVCFCYAFIEILYNVCIGV